MIDIENYERAIAWLHRGLNELWQEPDDQAMQLDLLHRFEVTHNVTEGLLREAFNASGEEEHATYLSLRELLRRSAEEGFVLCSARKWLQYGLLLELAKEAWMETATVNLETILAELPFYAKRLDGFSLSLKQRAARLV